MRRARPPTRAELHAAIARIDAQLAEPEPTGWHETTWQRRRDRERVRALLRGDRARLVGRLEEMGGDILRAG